MRVIVCLIAIWLVGLTLPANGRAQETTPPTEIAGSRDVVVGVEFDAVEFAAFEFYIEDHTTLGAAPNRAWSFFHLFTTSGTIDSGTFEHPLKVSQNPFVFDAGGYHLTCAIDTATVRVITHDAWNTTTITHDGSPTLFAKHKDREAETRNLSCTLVTPTMGTLIGRTTGTVFDHTPFLLQQASHVISNIDVGCGVGVPSCPVP